LVVAHNQHTRASIATALPKFSSQLGNDYVLDKLTNCFFDAVNDGSREVKLAAISALRSDDMNISMALNFLKNVASSSTEWRERREICECLPEILIDPDESEMGIVELFLNDSAFDVRNMMVKGLPILKDRFGERWIETRIGPMLEKSMTSDDYSLRQTAVLAVSELGGIGSTGIRIVRDGARDRVANVRLIVAKVKGLGDADVMKILKEDEDEDVREEASRECTG
jgi:hypothetical protein